MGHSQQQHAVTFSLVPLNKLLYSRVSTLNVGNRRYEKLHDDTLSDHDEHGDETNAATGLGLVMYLSSRITLRRGL